MSYALTYKCKQTSSDGVKCFFSVMLIEASELLSVEERFKKWNAQGATPSRIHGLQYEYEILYFRKI